MNTTQHENSAAHCQASCIVSKYTSPIWGSKLEAQMSHNLYKKGQYIYYQNNPSFGLHFICDGKVKIMAMGRKGKEQIVRLAGNGHILGQWNSDSDQTYSNSAVAIEDSLICFLSNETLREAFLANPELTLNIMRFYSQELNKSEKRLQYLSQTSIHQRVAEALLYIIEVFGICPKHSKITVRLSRKEIGSIIGATSEQVSRVLTSFKNEDIIDTDGKEIIIRSMNQLESFSRGEEFELA